MNDMRVLQQPISQPNQWAVFTHMRGVLCRAGAVNKARQAFGVGDVGGHRAAAEEPWPGASVGVRAPFPGETPLSPAEVGVLLRCSCGLGGKAVK